MAAAVFLVPDREALASSLVVMGGAMVVVAVLLPRLVGRLELGPGGLKAEIAELRRDVEKVDAEVREVKALIVEVGPAVEHDQALPITPSKSVRVGRAEERDEALPITPRKGSDPPDDG